MKDLIANFPGQLREAIGIAENSVLNIPANQIQNVLITGLGGSGIGGTIAAEIAARQTPVPIVVSKGYFVPDWVSDRTLVIASSYSGNTEETINALDLAISRKAKVVCITSGGKIAEIAREHHFDLILVPGGFPPRACLGYSLVQVLHVLHAFGCISNDPLTELTSSADLIEKNLGRIQEEAQKITAFLKGKIPVLYATTYREGIAIRWRQQINENSKMLCWHHVVPEMNHNELVGWRIEDHDLAVVYLRDKADYERNQKRFEVNKEVILKCTPNLMETWSEGNSVIEKAIWQIHLGDWVSWYLSVERGVDATEVKVIDHLKSELSKF